MFLYRVFDTTTMIEKNNKICDKEITKGMITSQSELVLNITPGPTLARRAMWLYISPFTASIILPSTLTKGCEPVSVAIT